MTSCLGHIPRRGAIDALQVMTLSRKAGAGEAGDSAQVFLAQTESEIVQILTDSDSAGVSMSIKINMMRKKEITFLFASEGEIQPLTYAAAAKAFGFPQFCGFRYFKALLSLFVLVIVTNA